MGINTPFHIDRLGRRNIRWNRSRVEPCGYVNKGEAVLAPAYENGAAITKKVIVECAAGTHARVKGDGISGWYHVDDLARMKEKKDD